MLALMYANEMLELAYRFERGETAIGDLLRAEPPPAIMAKVPDRRGHHPLTIAAMKCLYGVATRGYKNGRSVSLPLIKRKLGQIYVRVLEGTMPLGFIAQIGK